MELIDRPYIRRVSFLGGECLAEQNLDEVLSLIKEIRISFPEKSIWLYTGFQWNYIMNYQPERNLGDCDKRQMYFSLTAEGKKILKEMECCNIEIPELLRSVL